jgi:signal transduction histidine kinase
MEPDSRVNILLVDDQPAKLLSYEVILGGLSENLYKAASARDAFEILLKRDIAVVLIDVCMPELDGFELAGMIRNHPRFTQTAIIFVSAIAMTDIDRIKGYEHGGVDYVPVPVVPEILRAKVRIFAELYRKTHQLETLNAGLERRVAERTAELEAMNAELEQRVEERTRERQLALAQVHEMQKLDSLGQLTGGVAHDFNNLLMAILGNLEMLGRRLPPDDSCMRFVAGATRAAERGANLTKRLLAFARHQELKPESVDIVQLTEEMGEILRRSIGPAIELVVDLPNGLAPVRADRNQLELSLLNLALNSRDAMPEGGRLAITASHRVVLADNLLGLDQGDYVCIAVTDTGIGMDENVLRRAAEPFFTTKQIGKGTGLGLSTVYGLTKQSGGVTRISSRPGIGTVVELWLPAAGPVTAAPDAPAVSTHIPAVQPCRVLLVEDDPLVAESTVAMLELLGSSVVVAPSGSRALEIIGDDAALDLVITDHAMPGMSGLQLAQHIRAIKPGLSIVLATGYAERLDVAGIPLLDKPYRLDALATVIGSLQTGRLSPHKAAD